jgi:SOS-response transcriptional repressor LexA
MAFGDGTPPPMRLREMRERAGFSMPLLAKAIGYAGASSYQRYESEDYRKRYLPRELVEKLADVLPGKGDPPVTIEEVCALAGMPPPVVPKISTASGPIPHATPVEFGKADLPVLGRAQGGTGILAIPADQQPVDWTYRPPQLVNVPDAFAIFAYDDSMYPMYKHGQTLWIHPHLPAKPDDGVLIIRHNDEAIIKQLVRRTEKSIRVREWHPKAREFDVPSREIRHVYRIVGVLDLR